MSARAIPFRVFYDLGIDTNPNRLLRLDINAFADLELQMGLGPDAIFDQDRAGFAVIRGFLWAGLKWQHRKLTVEQVGEWLQNFVEKSGGAENSEEAFAQLMIPLMEAMQASNLMAAETPAEEKAEGEGEGPNVKGDSTETTSPEEKVSQAG